ncbi:hypothetical protein [Caenimonas sp. SL110]|uniref:M10 family metallopeptidase C-terminal domain-containing protein n=1 Tax=Caenimonas sp. SL110 TaxID=1450524 RepID=UPI000652F38D|nr:hypothetical protein [Caenimonas sp. SL110]
MPNSAPTLDSLFSPVLTTTFENAASLAWTTVSALLAGGSDADTNPLGIAITALDTSMGTWQFSNDAGANWLTIHASLINSSTNELALLLAPTALVRMLPFGELNGTLAEAITFRAWDQTSGNQGDYVVIAGTGADSAFSSDSDTAGLTVTAVNDAPTFAPVAGTGKALVAVGPSSDYGQSVTVQPDGKIVIAGYSNNGINDDFGLVRLNADGTLDTSFNGTGKALIPLAGGNDSGSSVIVQTDGKILIAGSSDNGTNFDFSLIRLNANGTLDTSFNGTGKALVPVGISYDFGNSITVQPDGKIVIAGNSFNGSGYDFGVVRLTIDGTLDTSFNGTGKAQLPVGTGYDFAGGVAMQPDGKIVVAGTGSDSSNQFGLIRLNADGSLDTSFNSTGRALVPVGGSGDTGKCIIVQPDGKIVVAGTSYTGLSSDFGVIRFDADGTLDTSFNGTGKAMIPVGTAFDTGTSAILQPDGKIVIAGSSARADSGDDFSLIRLNADGTLDTSFNGTGKILVQLGSNFESATSVTLQPDGKIVVAGYSYNVGAPDFGVLRLNADGTLDTSFNGTVANTLGGTVATTENAAAIALDPSVSIYDAELGTAGAYDGATFTLARSSGTSPEDVFSGLGNLSFNVGNAVLSGVTIGTVTNTGGALTITFNGNATQARVNEALSSIGYANASDNPSASVQIGWSFSDGNISAQGTGGALTATGSTTVNITPVNDLPTGEVTISGVATVGNLLTATNTLADAEGIDTPVVYQWQADGEDIDGAVGDTFTVTSAEFGKVISVEASYTDGRDTHEAVTVTMSNAAGAVLTAQPDEKFLFGSFGSDLLIASGRTKMLGGDGDDTYLPGGKGQVIEAKGEGEDTVISTLAFVLGPNVENLILQGTGDIKGTGNELDNEILGNSADNKLTGLGGADTLTGAAGADRFIYTSVADSNAMSLDTIADFNAAEGDKIRLTQVDANEALIGNQKFTFIGSQPFSDFADATGLLRFDPATHQLEGSVNANGAAELVIVLAGVVSLTGADIDL